MRAVSTLILAGLLSSSVAAHGSAQTPGNPEPKLVCFRGRPAQFCRAFWLTEAGYYRRVGGSGFVEEAARGSFNHEHLASHVSWEIGGMVNRAPKSAVGATVLLGKDGIGNRVGLKGRYRWWLDQEGGTLDLSAGLLSAETAGSFPDFSPQAMGLTADLSFGWRDFIATSVRGDLLRRRDQTVNAVYGGLRLGSYPAVVGTAAAAIVIGVFYAFFFARGDF